jgi:hypothetical protein
LFVPTRLIPVILLFWGEGDIQLNSCTTDAVACRCRVSTHTHTHSINIVASPSPSHTQTISKKKKKKKKTPSFVSFVRLKSVPRAIKLRIRVVLFFAHIFVLFCVGHNPTLLVRELRDLHAVAPTLRRGRALIRVGTRVARPRQAQAQARQGRNDSGPIVRALNSLLTSG